MRDTPRRLSLLLFIALAIITVSILAPQPAHAAGGSITASDARQAALAWLSTCPSFADAKYAPAAEMLEIRSADGRAALAYVLKLEPKGYIVVTPSYDLEPIIAYSSESAFSAEESPENALLDLLRADIPQRLKALQDGRVSKIDLDKARATWASHLAGSSAPDANQLKGARAELAWDVEHGPFLTTVWGQGDNWLGDATFNYYTPPGPDGDGDNYVAGCVATALGQILNYYEWPTTGSGSHSYLWDNGVDAPRSLSADFGSTTYDWANMLDDYVGTGSVAEREAVGELLYHAGVAVDMNYADGLSGAFTPHVANALSDYYRSQGVWFPYSDADTGAAFYAELYTNMTRHRPAELSISGPAGGHAVVVDGVQHFDGDTKWYHLNMGWYGSQDGWYDIVPPFTAGYEWTTVKGAVLDIVPIPDLLDPGGSITDTTFTVSWLASLNQDEDCYELQKTGFPSETSSLTDGAEGGTTNWTISNNWEDTTVSKHLESYSFRGYFTKGLTKNTMRLTEPFMVAADSSISYWWRTNYFYPATGSAEARIEISSDGNWSTLETHTDDFGTTWTQQTIPASSLAPYVDKPVFLRLVVQAWDSYYYGDDYNFVGFFLDDLSINNIREDSGWASVDDDIHGESKSVTVTAYGDYYFRTRAYCDGVWGDWSDIEDLTVYKPEAVGLASFDAQPAAGGIRVTWQTGSELNNVGFDLFRSESEGGPASQINSSLIPSKRGGSVAGASYAYLDRDVTPGQSYWYWLQDVDDSGATTRHGPISVTAPTNRPPVNISVSPDEVTSQPLRPVEFTCTYADPDGWQDIRFADLLISDSRSGASGVWLRYFPATGKTSLRMPVRKLWRRLRGNPATRMNPSAIVELANVVKDGETLQITYRIKAKGSFLGDWNLYLRVRDRAGLTDWFDDLGSWVVAD